jgi:hypothetical protein
MEQRRSIPVERLASQVRQAYGAEGNAALYVAIHLVAKELGITTEARDEFLKALGIRKFSRDEDDAVLKSLGLCPLQTVQERVLSSLLPDKIVLKDDYWSRLITSAATILLFLGGDLRKAPPAGASDLRTQTRTPRTLTLAVVLKGTDVGSIEVGSSFSVDLALTLLEKATYFACALEEDVSKSIGESAWDVQPIDRESEKQALAVINFLYSENIPAEGFQTKLDVLKFLRTGRPNGFTVARLIGNVKVGGLSKSGFVRV